MQKRTNSKSPLLTISVMSSGRDQTIYKCLDSLDRLRERVPSELIVTDTTPDGRLIQELSAYTDIILPFEWINDFSAARNVSLRAAKGEWYLYLDDDEWFVDTDEIETFFLSGEYKLYGYANYLQRNYYREDESISKDIAVSRCFRIGKDTRFVSTIHEMFSPALGPVKRLHSAVKHFGYCYATPEDQRRHYQRNVVLLQEMIIKEPREYRWRAQITQEYRSVKEFSKLLEITKESLKVCAGENNPGANQVRGTFYNGYIDALIKLHDREGAIAAYEESIADRRNNEICRAALYMQGVDLYFQAGDYANCEAAADEYLLLYEKYHEDIDAIQEAGFFYVNEAFDEDNVNQVLSQKICCGLRREDPGPLKRYFYELGWEDQILYINDSLVDEMLKWMARNPEDPDYPDMIKKITSREAMDYALRKIAKEIDKEDGLEEFLNLCGLVWQVESDLAYVGYMKLSAAIDQGYQAMLDLAGAMGYRKWTQAVDELCQHGRREIVYAGISLIEESAPEDSPYPSVLQYYFLRVLELELLEKIKGDEMTLEEITGTVSDYSGLWIDYYSGFFKERCFMDMMEYLPERGQLAVRLSTLVYAVKNGDVSSVTGTMKACMNVYKPFNDVVKKYTALYAAEYGG